LAILGTLAGTGLGYLLSTRGKRQEWKKEYREKRTLPVVEHVNRHTQALLQLSFAVEDEKELEKQYEESESKVRELEKECDESDSKERLEQLLEATKQHNERLEKLLKATAKSGEEWAQLVALFRSHAWLGFLAIGGLDEELSKLLKEWAKSCAQLANGFSDTQLEATLALGIRILNRADEFILRG
jgi:septal ring factor EnvC (AmiA/AmiB activator)